MYTMLIADDEPLERKALRKILTDNIPEISRIEDSCDGQSALEKAQEVLPDMIILDIKMPRVNGLDAARRIKSFLPSCHIILLSGYTYFNYAKEAVSIGINDFLVKPVSDDELIASVKSLIQGLEKQRIQSHEKEGKTEKICRLCDCLENELITSLPFQQMKEPHLSRHLEALDIDFAYSISLILSSDPQINDLDFENLRKMISSYFSPNRIFIQKVDNFIYGLIFLTRYIQKPQIKESLEYMVNEISSNLSVTFHVGAGTIKSQASEIFESFNEARRALPSEASVGLFEPNLSTKGIPLSRDKEEQLLDSIINGDEEKSLAILSEVYQIIDNNYKDFSDFKIQVYEMLLILNGRLRREISIDDGLFYNRYLDDCTSRTEVKTYLIQEVLKMIGKVNKFITTSNKAWKSQIISYLEKNYKKPITLQQLADMAGFSTSYLSRVFKKEFGMNCISFVNHLRIKKAKVLLTTSDLSIKEIAYAIGYSDANYFARVFKKETGINASQYKNSTA